MSGPPEVPTVVRLLDQARVEAYAGAAHDHNPLHLDPEFAKQGGFDGAIAHGMLVLALVSEAMVAAFGVRWAEAGALKVRWRAPATIPAMVTVHAELRSDRDGVASYDVTCTDDRGDVLLSGTASAPYGSAETRR